MKIAFGRVAVRHSNNRNADNREYYSRNPFRRSTSFNYETTATPACIQDPQWLDAKSRAPIRLNKRNTISLYGSARVWIYSLWWRLNLKMWLRGEIYEDHVPSSSRVCRFFRVSVCVRWITLMLARVISKRCLSHLCARWQMKLLINFKSQ